MSEKNQPPTQSRLRQARNDGQLGISQDLLRILKLVVMCEVAFATEAAWRRLIAELFEASLRAASQPLHVPLAIGWDLLRPVVVLTAVLAVLPAALAIVTTLAQTRFNIAGKALGKGFEKFNIGNNLKSLVSPQKLLMAVLGPLKGGALLWVTSAEIRSQLPTVALAFRLDPGTGWELSMLLLHQLERQCIVVLIILAIIDVVMQRILVFRQLRMDVSEVRRDYKQNEGDPMLKQARRQEGIETLMSAGPQKAQPTTVVVNPEHLAVELFYEAGITGVPIVLEMGADEDAMAIRRRARERGVPIVRYVDLARHLYAKATPGAPVPASSYRAVALLLRVMDLYRTEAPETLKPRQAHFLAEHEYLLPEVEEQLGKSMFPISKG